ncbi:MAG: hypothetical protein ACI8PB_003217 [Desulforhopalus sp.]|jgi:hypothetical protein
MSLLDFALRQAFIVDENDYLGLYFILLSAHLRDKKNPPPLIHDANPTFYDQNTRTISNV